MELNLTQHIVIEQHAMAVYGIGAYENDLFFSGGADKVVALWNSNTGKQMPFAVKTEHSIYAVQFKAPNLLSVGLSNGDIHWIDTKTKQEVKYFKTLNQGIFSQLFLKNSNHLLTGDSDGNLRLWDLEDQKLAMTFPLVCDKIRGLAQSPDGKQLALASKDGKIRIFDTEFFNEKNCFFAHNEGANAVKFISQQSNNIISGGKDGYLRVWNIDTGEKIKAIPAHNYAIYAIDFIENGKYFVTCSRDKSIKLWNTATFEVIQKITAKNGGHRHSVNQIICMKDKIISCSDDRRIIVWKIEQDKKN